MTRKYIFLFLTAVITIFCLLYGLFGQKGFIVNRALQKQLKLAQEFLTDQRSELNSLKNSYKTLWEENSLLEKGKQYGYAQKGEVLYYFFDSEGQILGKSQEKQTAKESLPPVTYHVKGLPSGLILLIALTTALFISVLYGVFAYRRKRRSQLNYPL
ncbi:MAG: hypothetical protein WC224_08250 [Sphaerochaetaceae bacterium]|jgi:cell division protein FtsB